MNTSAQQSMPDHSRNQQVNIVFDDPEHVDDVFSGAANQQSDMSNQYQSTQYPDSQYTSRPWSYMSQPGEIYDPRHPYTMMDPQPKRLYLPESSYQHYIRDRQRHRTIPIQIHTPSRSKLAAGLLGIFFGGFGVHNFYLHRMKRGLAQLALTLLSGGFLFYASAIWGCVEGIRILASDPNDVWSRDGWGKPLTS
jgi:TM2 domain-containing membrane protein YozV